MRKTLDLVEVIRCKNCRYCAPTAVKNIKFCIIWNKYVQAEDYCSQAERKSEVEGE